MQKQAAPAAAGKVAEPIVEELKTAASSEQADEFVATVSPELVRWRTVRDSLKGIVDKPAESLMSKYGVNSLKSDTKKKAAASLSLKDSTEVKTRYLESCFQVALLTDDPIEYADSKRILETVAKSSDSTAAATAQGYLDRLAAERPTPPQK